MASLLTPEFVGGRRPARRTPRSRPPRSRSGTSARRPSTRRWSRRASSRRGPGSAASSRRPRTPAGSWASRPRRPRPSVHAILEYAVGPERAARFDVFLAGDCVPKKKPAPDIYLLALEKLGVAAGRGARRRGLAQRPARPRSAPACAVSMTVNGYTEEEDFSEAILVVSSLGDPDGERTTRHRQPRGRPAGRLRHARGPRGLPGLVDAVRQPAPSHEGRFG